MTTTITGATGVSQVQAGAIEHGDLPSGSVIQVVNFQTGAVATGTGAIPLDDTIPQNTEGSEYMTLAITPVSATSKLRIDTTCVVSYSTAAIVMMCLFQDTTANALATNWVRVSSGSYQRQIVSSYIMTAGTTSETTFKVRLGGNGSGTTTFNGYGGASKLGGTLASSIIITEYTP